MQQVGRCHVAAVLHQSAHVVAVPTRQDDAAHGPGEKERQDSLGDLPDDQAPDAVPVRGESDSDECADDRGDDVGDHPAYEREIAAQQLERDRGGAVARQNTHQTTDDPRAVVRRIE